MLAGTDPRDTFSRAEPLFASRLFFTSEMSTLVVDTMYIFRLKHARIDGTSRADLFAHSSVPLPRSLVSYPVGVQ